jgi:hypothetical protein
MFAITAAKPPLALPGNASAFTTKQLLHATYTFQVVTWYGGNDWGEPATVEVQTP